MLFPNQPLYIHPPPTQLLAINHLVARLAHRVSGLFLRFSLTFTGNHPPTSRQYPPVQSPLGFLLTRLAYCSCSFYSRGSCSDVTFSPIYYFSMRSWEFFLTTRASAVSSLLDRKMICWRLFFNLNNHF